MRNANPRRLAGRVAESGLFRRARSLWDANQRDWNLPLSKWQKLTTGVFIILRDYATGRFPPTFEDQQVAYDAEISYSTALPGMTPEEIALNDIRKPFWHGALGRRYITDFTHICRALESCDVVPPQSLLELGCGSGWTAEFLAATGFDVLGTTLSPVEVDTARRRIDSLTRKWPSAHLEYRSAPMESVTDAVADRAPFDCVYVYEALHHAFDWRTAIAQAYDCLRPGGWLLICNEPNILHTCIAYRVARIANIHEIGFGRSALLRALKQSGFRRTRVLRNRCHLFVRHHWIAAQK